MSFRETHTYTHLMISYTNTCRGEGNILRIMSVIGFCMMSWEAANESNNNESITYIVR